MKGTVALISVLVAVAFLALTSARDYQYNGCHYYKEISTIWTLCYKSIHKRMKMIFLKPGQPHRCEPAKFIYKPCHISHGHPHHHPKPHHPIHGHPHHKPHHATHGHPHHRPHHATHGHPHHRPHHATHGHPHHRPHHPGHGHPHHTPSRH